MRMIEINLLPVELRVKTKGKKNGSQACAKFKIDREKFFLFALPGVLAVLICLHLFFAVLVILKNNALISLNKKWIGLEQQKKTLDAFNAEYSFRAQDAGFIQKITQNRVFWAAKLNKLSLNLPPGVWFNSISIDTKGLNIQGSVVSLQKKEVNLINDLIDNLKADEDFSKDFTSIAVSSVQKKSVGGYDIGDFTLLGEFKIR